MHIDANRISVLGGLVSDMSATQVKVLISRLYDEQLVPLDWLEDEIEHIQRKKAQ